jgi:hypothetical protein
MSLGIRSIKLLVSVAATSVLFGVARTPRGCDIGLLDAANRDRMIVAMAAYPKLTLLSRGA